MSTPQKRQWSVGSSNFAYSVEVRIHDITKFVRLLQVSVHVESYLKQSTGQFKT